MNVTRKAADLLSELVVDSRWTVPVSTDRRF